MGLRPVLELQTLTDSHPMIQRFQSQSRPEAVQWASQAGHAFYRSHDLQQLPISGCVRTHQRGL